MLGVGVGVGVGVEGWDGGAWIMSLSGHFIREGIWYQIIPRQLCQNSLNKRHVSKKYYSSSK